MADLELFLVTYNRASYLRRTLEALGKSIFKDFSITILNNASTDDTEMVVSQVSDLFSDLRLITHRNNIGANANIVRAIELSKAKYTWVLCDDDDYDFSQVDDILAAVKSGDADLIHTGAHADLNLSAAGLTLTPKQLLKQNYNYFKAGSFLPCNIFRTQKFQTSFLIPAYNNIVNAYPHMPYVLGVYENDMNVYLCKNRIVTAKGTSDGYNHYSWFFWWLNTCKLLKNDSDVGIAFLDHFPTQEQRGGLFYGMAEMSLKNPVDKDIIFSFVRRYLKNDFGLLISQMRNIERNRKLRPLKQFVKTLIGKK